MTRLPGAARPAGETQGDWSPCALSEGRGTGSESREDPQRSLGPGEDPLPQVHRLLGGGSGCKLRAGRQRTGSSLCISAHPAWLRKGPKAECHSGTPTSQESWTAGLRGRRASLSSAYEQRPATPKANLLLGIPPWHQQAETPQGERGAEAGRAPMHHHDSAFTFAKRKSLQSLPSRASGRRLLA